MANYPATKPILLGFSLIFLFIVLIDQSTGPSLNILYSEINDIKMILSFQVINFKKLSSFKDPENQGSALLLYPIFPKNVLNTEMT